MSSPPNDGCPRCLAFGHLGFDQSYTHPTGTTHVRINPDRAVTSILDTGPAASYHFRPCHADWFVTSISAVSTLLPGELELRHHTSRVPKGEAPGAPNILGNGGSHYPAPGPPALWDNVPFNLSIAYIVDLAGLRSRVVGHQHDVGIIRALLLGLILLAQLLKKRSHHR